jgi:hypothetical protein
MATCNRLETLWRLPILQQTGSAEKGGVPQSCGGSAQKQGRKQREPGSVDVLQFLKYFHLVPAQVTS